MISDELRCIFLHPNKCGGKSIENALWDIKPVPGSADHRTISDFRRTYPEKVDPYFKFIFCRNPWDRLVSIYHGRKQILGIDMPPFRNFILDADPGQSPTKQQVEWIKEGAEFTIDFIGRFETYEMDWSKVCRRLGIQVKLPHLNKSEHASYTELYTPDLAECIREKYKEDICYFGYECPNDVL